MLVRCSTVNMPVAAGPSAQRPTSDRACCGAAKWRFTCGVQRQQCSLSLRRGAVEDALGYATTNKVEQMCRDGMDASLSLHGASNTPSPPPALMHSLGHISVATTFLLSLSGAFHTRTHIASSTPAGSYQHPSAHCCRVESTGSGHTILPRNTARPVYLLSTI